MAIDHMIPTGDDKIAIRRNFLALEKALSRLRKIGTDSLTINNPQTSHTLTNPTDSPATADALRDDLVTNVIPSIKTALDNLGTILLAVLQRLQSLE